MPLKEMLKEIVDRVDGALSVMVMASDGIPVEEYCREDSGLDMQLFAVEYATLLREVSRMVSMLDAGDLEEVSVSTASLRVILRTVGSDLCLALVMECGGNFGKGRYLLKLRGTDVARELC